MSLSGPTEGEMVMHKRIATGKHQVVISDGGDGTPTSCVKQQTFVVESYCFSLIPVESWAFLSSSPNPKLHRPAMPIRF